MGSVGDRTGCRGIRVLSVEEIASRLDDRFSLLTAGSRTAIPRHQTLRATIDWSHDLLTEPERILFRRLSVFAGGFTLEAAESVCSDEMPTGRVLDLLGRLADKSLVIAEAGSETIETRYRMLETIRQYALETLVGTGEAQSVGEPSCGLLHAAELKKRSRIISAANRRYGLAAWTGNLTISEQLWNGQPITVMRLRLSE